MSAADAEPLYDEARVPRYALPDPLVGDDGRPVRDAADWRTRRRPELLRAFARHVYGRMPPPPRDLRIAVELRDDGACGGLATRLELSLRVHADLAPIRLCVWLPNRAQSPAPAFLGLNFRGNHACHPDPSITLCTGWINAGDGDGIVANRATAAARGMRASLWPVEMILARGYALATAFLGDLLPDRADALDARLLAALAAPDRRADDACGAIGVWAWALSRGLDALTTLDRIDAGRVAVVGHSRLGKTALWAAACDERFALAVSNESGQGGAALTRRRFGETIRHITTAFPHWFCPAHAAYAGREDDLPVDQHELLALIAPRPVYVASADADLWADPRGEFLACVGADPVHRLLGGTGLAGATAMPAAGAPTVGGTIGYHLRAGAHALTAFDWWRFLDFADRHLRA